MRPRGPTLAAAAALTLFASATAAAEAPISTERSGGLYTATFPVPEGTIRVHLPDDLAAGDTISGTVVAEPAGDTERERQRNSDRLEGYVVEVGEARTSAAEGVLRWSVPAAAAAAIALIDRRGQAVSRTEVPVRPVPPSPAADFRLPPVTQAGRPLEVAGPFDGDLTNTGLRFGGRETAKLAESPRKVVARSPAAPLGPVAVEVEEGGTVTRGEVRNVAVRLEAPRTSLVRGESTTLTVTVEGLGGLDEALPLRLENRSPGVVEVEGGDEQTLVVAPDAVRPGGTWSVSRALTGIRSGSFSLTASVRVPAASPLALASQDFLDGVNEWLCDDCAKECRTQAEACGDPGNRKWVGPEEKVGKAVTTSRGDTWQKIKRKWSECVKEECRWLTLYCCEYTRWQERGYAYGWRVKAKGGEEFAPPADAIPCHCGELIDILFWVAGAGAAEKEDMLKFWAAKRCPGLTWEGAASMAKACGLEEAWDNATTLTGADVVKWLQDFLGAFSPK